MIKKLPITTEQIIRALKGEKVEVLPPPPKGFAYRIISFFEYELVNLNPHAPESNAEPLNPND